MEMQRQTAYSSEKSSEMMHGMHGGKFPFRPFLFCSCVVKYYQPKMAEEGLLLKWLQHLRTVQHHRFLVLRHCWRVGLYRQGLTHDLSKFSLSSLLRGHGIIRETAVRTRSSGAKRDTAPHGCTTRAATVIIWNTGSTMRRTARVCAA